VSLGYQMMVVGMKRPRKEQNTRQDRDNVRSKGKAERTWTSPVDLVEPLVDPLHPLHSDSSIPNLLPLESPCSQRSRKESSLVPAKIVAFEWRSSPRHPIAPGEAGQNQSSPAPPNHRQYYHSLYPRHRGHTFRRRCCCYCLCLCHYYRKRIPCRQSRTILLPRRRRRRYCCSGRTGTSSYGSSHHRQQRDRENGSAECGWAARLGSMLPPSSSSSSRPNMLIQSVEGGSSSSSPPRPSLFLLLLLSATSW